MSVWGVECYFRNKLFLLLNIIIVFNFSNVFGQEAYIRFIEMSIRKGFIKNFQSKKIFTDFNCGYKEFFH